MVIERHIREGLGVTPGMITVQGVVDDHVELRFVPGPHDRSLAGAARPHITRFPAPDELEHLEEAWAAGAARHDAERTGPGDGRAIR